MGFATVLPGRTRFHVRPIVIAETGFANPRTLKTKTIVHRIVFAAMVYADGRMESIACRVPRIAGNVTEAATVASLLPGKKGVTAVPAWSAYAISYRNAVRLNGMRIA